MKQLFSNPRRLLAFWGIVVFGVGLRLYQFPQVPAGLNQDELSAGYEAWSLLLQGTDRWGYHLPAYFLSWGSGMNVLYSYLSVPFIALFGLTAIAVRSVALIAGILLLPLIYLTVKRWLGYRFGLCAMAIVAIMPWGWMTARWGLESNLLPVVMLLGVYTLGVALGSAARTWQRIIALLPFGFALYAYGLGLPTVVTLLLLVGIRYWRQIRAHLISWLISLGLTLVVALPFLLFFLKAYVLKADLPFEQYLPFTLPTLTVTRLDQVGNVLAGYPPVFANAGLLISGFQDGSIWNSLPGYATIPVVLILLAAVEVVARLIHVIRQQRSPQPDLLDLWLLACLPLFLLITLNVNQGNAIYLPLVIAALRGGHRLLRHVPTKIPRRLTATALALLIAIPSLLGYAYYTNGAYTAAAGQAFNPSLGNALVQADQIVAGKPLYITTNIPLAYVQTLWYLHVPATTFQAAHPKVDGSKNFKNIRFDAPDPTAHGYYYFGRGQEKPACDTYRSVHKLGYYSLGYCA